MKFVFSNSALYSRLAVLGRIISNKNNLAILSDFLFEVRNNQLTISASDGEATLTSTIDLIESDGECKMAINSKNITDALKELPEQPITIYFNESTYALEVEYQNGKFSMMSESAEEFPLPSTNLEKETKLILPIEYLLKSINLTINATKEDEYRPTMNSIFFDMEEKSITLVATDGLKLVSNKLKGLDFGKESSFVLPKKVASLLKNILPKEEGEATISYTEKNAVIITTNYKLSCRLIEGRFPNYKSVIPQNNDIHIAIDRVALISALRRVSIFSTSDMAMARFHFEPNKVKISCQDIDFAMSAEESLICDYQGKSFDIGFKSNSLIELLPNIDSTNIVFKIADASKAVLIVPEETEENIETTLLIIPMMLNN